MIQDLFDQPKPATRNRPLAALDSCDKQQLWIYAQSWFFDYGNSIECKHCGATTYIGLDGDWNPRHNPTCKLVRAYRRLYGPNSYKLPEDTIEILYLNGLQER